MSTLWNLRSHKYLYLGCLLLQLGVFAAFNCLWVDRSCCYLSVQPDSRFTIEVCLNMMGIGPESGAFPYSPFIQLITLPLIYGLGLNEWPFFVLQMGFAVVWVIATYLLGKEWFGERIGLAAASLLLWSIHPLIMVRNYLLDYPASAVFTLLLYFILKSRFFTNRCFSWLVLLSIPFLIAIKSQILFCLAPVLLGFSWVLLRRDYQILWGEPGLFGKASLLAQFLVPLFAGSLGLVLHYSPTDSFILLCLGIIAVNAWQSRLLFKASTADAQGKLPRYSSFLLYQGTLALTLLITDVVFTRIIVGADLALHASNNLGIPSYWQGNVLDTLQMVGYWVTGHFVELKTKHLQFFLFELYIVGLIWALARSHQLRGNAFLLYSTILSSLFLSMFTYNSLRYEVPLLCLRCIFAVFWIACLPGGLVLKWAVRLLVAGSIVNGIIFNGGWLFSKQIPRTSVENLFRELDVSYSLKSTANLDVFERTYDPNNRFCHTSGLGKQPLLLFKPQSFFSQALFFTCDPYVIDWGACACALRQTMRSPQEAAYLWVAADDLSDLLFLKSDQLENNLNLSYRMATASSNIPIVPATVTDRPTHFVAVATSAGGKNPLSLGSEAQLIYTWNCPQLTLYLYRLPLPARL